MPVNPAMIYLNGVDGIKPFVNTFVEGYRDMIQQILNMIPENGWGVILTPSASFWTLKIHNELVREFPGQVFGRSVKIGTKRITLMEPQRMKPTDIQTGFHLYKVGWADDVASSEATVTEWEKVAASVISL